MTAKDPRSTAGSHGAVSVGTSATLVRQSNAGRRSILIQNQGTGDVYVGYSSSVTTANGVLLVAGSSFTDEKYLGAIYAITASGTQAIAYLEVGSATN